MYDLQNCREGFLLDAIKLEEGNLLSLIISEIKQDLYQKWLVTTDKEELLRIHEHTKALDLVTSKIQDYKNEIYTIIEESE